MPDKARKAFIWRLKRAWIEGLCRAFGHVITSERPFYEHTEDDVLWYCSRCGDPLSDEETMRCHRRAIKRERWHHA